MEVLRFKYKNASLRVELDQTLSARLFINNVQRMEKTCNSPVEIIRLSSSVQTDYEWHEFIEALLTFRECDVTISLRASDSEIAYKTTQMTFDSDRFK